MPYFSEADLNKIISFFSKVRTHKDDEKLLKRFAAENTAAFLKAIETDEIKIESQFNNEIPDSGEGALSTIVCVIRELWLDENKNPQDGCRRFNVTEESWQKAKDYYFERFPNAYNKVSLDEDNYEFKVKAVVSNEIYKQYLKDDNKVGAVRFRRLTRGGTLKDAKDFVDSWFNENLFVKDADAKLKHHVKSQINEEQVIIPVKSKYDAFSTVTGTLNHSFDALPDHILKIVFGRWVRRDIVNALELYRLERNIPSTVHVNEYYHDALFELTRWKLRLHTFERRYTDAVTFVSSHSSLPSKNVTSYVTNVLTALHIPAKLGVEY